MWDWTVNRLGDATGWLGYAVLLICQLAGLVLNLLGLPGLWLMVLSLILFAWLTGIGQYVGWLAILSTFSLALAAEGIEFAAGAVGSKAAGGSKRGMLGAIVGGLMGAIVGTPFLPPVGTIAGACVGCFVGAFLVERGIGRDTPDSLKIGAGAAAGRLVGIIIKTGIGLIILVISLWSAFASNTDSESAAGASIRPASATPSPANVPVEDEPAVPATSR